MLIAALPWCGLLYALLAAFALHRASPQAPRALPRPRRTRWRVVGWLAMLIALASWVSAFGAAAGVAATLVSAMLGLVAAPWLALAAQGRSPSREPHA